MNRINLNGEWKVKTESLPEITGVVPGSVLNDLKSSGIIEGDFFYRDNAEKVQCFENYDWKYTKLFNIQKSDCTYKLVFEQLDTYCDIYINGTLIEKCMNGFIKHEFLIGDFIQNGENVLEVQFYSPIKAVEGMPIREAAFTAERLNTRRVQCTYGWDWTMRFVTCGISGDVYIEEYSDESRIESVYIYTKNVDDESAQVGVDVSFENLCNKIYTFAVYYKNECVKKYPVYCAEKFLRLSLEIENAKLWYPSGYGEANLYTLKIEDGDTVLHSEEFGIRTVKIMQLTDSEESENYKKCLELRESAFSSRYDKNEKFSGFTIKVNGTKIMCKGANYVPVEPFETGEKKEKIASLLKMAKESGVNMIRVWGGGKFEIPFFYDECSRLGIMVTQDFLMACGEYPEKEEWFLSELKKEAEYATILIRNKACLMWWTGDNENATHGSIIDTDYTGRDSAYKAIAPVVYKNDPYREFLPSSPYGGYKYASNTVGTTHNSNFIGRMFQYMEEADPLLFFEYMKYHRARFIAEEPTMGAVEIDSLRKFMTEDDIFGKDLSMWNYHTKTNPPLDLFGVTCNFAEKLLGKFKDGYDRYIKLKYIQYEWVRISMEQARREKWFCSGILFWMLNDCWPASSGWALIDYYNRPKASLYSFMRCARDVMSAIDKNIDGSFSAYICNDTVKESKVSVSCYVLDYKTNAKKQLFEKEIVTSNDKNARIDFKTDLEETEIIICNVAGDDVSDRSFFKNGTLPLKSSNGVVKITEKGSNYVVLKAEGYVHATVLVAECTFSDNYFSMVKGEERKIFFDLYDGDSASDISVECYTLE